MKKLFTTVLVSCLFTSAAYAGYVKGTVTRLIVRDDGLHYVHIDGQMKDRPACAQNHTYWMIKDENSAYGKSQYSMLLAAKASGKVVTVAGTGTCTRWKDGEDIEYVSMD
ncbi:hypothetical protein [Photobacterium galatheae]|uniref:Uncharacterized protein n=1 Tax=Photobacterium galatheae TaxID=1654360 RepID=A0A066RPI3_9GAMM|nr:hypothetical protein [Photobacterium galatheae]KDM92375.1 hypothetical protein EA58_06555 [Photobacterium galatheae]MCM0150884.1 hypothetical protein [Photobacterium galatheae]